MSVKLVEVIRGNLIESIHHGDVAVVNSCGSVLFELGNTERMVFYRSTSKPLQAIATLESGIAEEYNLDLKEIALMISSHSGENMHISILKGIMEKAGIDEDEVKCGIHEPVNKEVSRELAVSGRKPSNLHCNCSGKHVALIAASRLKGYEEEYWDMKHGIQEDVVKVISEFSNIKTSDIVRAVDGCGIPVHAVPLKNMALSYANLCDEEFSNGKYRKSQNYVLSSMTMYPEMVAGTGRLDTEIMKLFGDRVISKIGAEGVYCAGIPGNKTGIAVKIEDGSSRAIGPVIMELLLQMDIIRKEEAEQLKQFWNPFILNHRQEKVGEIRAAFKVK